MIIALFLTYISLSIAIDSDLVCSNITETCYCPDNMKIVPKPFRLNYTEDYINKEVYVEYIECYSSCDIGKRECDRELLYKIAIICAKDKISITNCTRIYDKIISEETWKNYVTYQQKACICMYKKMKKK